MRSVVRYLVSVGCVIASLASTAHAQEASPKKFYKRDYASAPGAAGREYDAPRGSAQTEISPAKRGNSTEPARGSSSERKKRRVVVSVFVNSLDKEHFQKVMAEIISLHDSKQVFISTVQHIGDYRALTPELKEDLSKRHIMALEVSEPPREANVTMSPTWIITTKGGTHIAEGFLSLAPFIDEYGEYEPKLREKQADQVKVEGF